MSNIRFWTPDKIKKFNADFNIVVGGRSDGKTTAIIGEIVKEYLRTGRRGQYVRQLQEDFASGRGAAIMSSLEYAGENKDVNLIREWTGGKWDTTKFERRKWFLGRTLVGEDGETEVIWRDDPFCYATALSQTGRDKSATPSGVGIIHVDEFIPVNGRYLPDEIKLFMNTLSTTIRASDDVKVYLTANTTTWNSPYFEHFGIHLHVPKMRPGEVTVYESISGEVKSTLAVEYCTPATATGGGKPSDKYFIWGDNSNSRMIMSGEFSVPEYPKCPHQFTTRNVKCVYWMVEPDKRAIRVRLMKNGKDAYLFADKVEQTVFERLYRARDIIFSLDFTSERNVYTNPLGATDHPAIVWLQKLLRNNKIFFADNVVGTDFTYFMDRATRRSSLTP